MIVPVELRTMRTEPLLPDDDEIMLGNVLDATVGDAFALLVFAGVVLAAANDPATSGDAAVVGVADVALGVITAAPLADVVVVPVVVAAVGLTIALLRIAPEPAAVVTPSPAPLETTEFGLELIVAFTVDCGFVYCDGLTNCPVG
ncbi:MAG TPA: hypothetical protein VMU84_07895 [Thermoanaerobaculia bacterium]|nr:hypothetical protein [Thermoanaerobaculia bacterium]